MKMRHVKKNYLVAKAFNCTIFHVPWCELPPLSSQGSNSILCQEPAMPCYFDDPQKYTPQALLVRIMFSRARIARFHRPRETGEVTYHES